MKTITTIVLTVVAVLFGMQNFDHVPVYLFWGKPLAIRLIFVIATSGVAGYMIRYLISIRREDELKKRYKALMARQNRKKGYRPDDEDEDEF